METMFCSQCQETAMNSGCSKRGVCGKEASTANLQDVFIYTLKGISKVNIFLKNLCKGSKKADDFVMNGLFMTITNANFDNDIFLKKIKEGLFLRDELKKRASQNGYSNFSNVDVLNWTGSSIDDFENKSKSVGVLSYGNNAIRSLKQLLILGLKGICAYAEHANNLGYRDDDIFYFIESSLASTTEKQTMSELTSLVIKCGEFGVKVMNLLDKANTETFGNPVITEVNIGVKTRPGILVTGHDLRDFDELLSQCEKAEIDVYTHGEMLPAHYYPHFKKYKNLVGNYGGAWYNQVHDFESFNGPILFTTNCLVPPRMDSQYKDRAYTTGPVGYSGFIHIEDRQNFRQKDFSKIIEHAKSCKPPTSLEEGKIIGGFAHDQVIKLADKIIKAVNEGKIRKFIVMAGCDGRMKSREYYTEFAQNLPHDTVILTAGCAKYRYNKLNLGNIDGIPRILDAGQCNDSYSLVVIAQTLKEAFNLKDINDLPIVYNIAWYEQKAVLVLLSLLSLGIKNIHLGPTLPGFLSEDVTSILIDKFKLGGISSVSEDMKRLVN